MQLVALMEDGTFSALTISFNTKTRFMSNSVFVAIFLCDDPLALLHGQTLIDLSIRECLTTLMLFS